MKKLEGKVAVITGGSSGIGLATAKRFMDEGAHVVITGRREKELKEAAASIKTNVTTVVSDVSRLEDGAERPQNPRQCDEPQAHRISPSMEAWRKSDPQR